MRNTLLASALFIFCLSCKKDERDPDVNIIGKWAPVKTTYIETRYNNNVVTRIDTTVFTGQPGEYLQLNEDGTFEWNAIEASSGQNGNIWYGDDFILTTGTFSANYGIYSPASGKISLKGADFDNADIVLLTATQLKLSYAVSAYLGNDERETTEGVFEFKK